MKDYSELLKLLRGQQEEVDPMMSVGEPAEVPMAEELPQAQQDMAKNINPSIEDTKSINKDDKSPYIKEKDDGMDQRLRDQELRNSIDIPQEKIDLYNKYKASMSEKTPETTDDKVMNWLTGIGQASNVLNRLNNKPTPDVAYWDSVGKRSEEDKIKNKSTSIEKMQKMLNSLKLDKEGISFKDKERFKSQLRQQEAKTKSRIKEKEQKSKLSNAEIKKNLEDKRKAKSSIESIEEQLGKVKRAKDLLESSSKGLLTDTGPVDQYLSSFTNKGQELRQSLNDLSLDKMAKLFKGMSKAVDSDAERKMFEQSQASMSNYPAVNLKVLQNLEEGLLSLRNKNAQVYNNFDESGNMLGDPEEFSELEIPNNDNINTVERELEDGRRAIFNADTKEFIKFK